MGVQFDYPWFLLLLLLVPAAAVWMVRQDFRLRGGRKKAAVILRVIIAVLLILMLAGLQTFTLFQQKEIVYIADRSSSMPEDRGLRQWIAASAQSKGKQDTTAVVSTALDAAVERSPSGLPLAELPLDAALQPDFSNLERGLQLGSSLLRGPGEKRLVLITDGQENAGSMMAAGRLLKEKGIAVDVLESKPKQRKDVAINEIKLPDKLYQGERFALEAEIASSVKTTGELRVYEDSREIGRSAIELEPGVGRYRIEGLAKSPGLHRYRAEIFAAGDEQSANNTAYAISRTSGPPRILVVEGQPGSSGNITSALGSGFASVKAISPQLLSLELADLLSYDSIIFNNVSGDQVGEKKMTLIEQAVRSYGVGFMMAGGEDSFALGGYFDTPIEKALPVRMELEGKRQIPSSGLILVIDRSGSMSGEKLELAKEAAMRTVELMRPQDTVGVVAFDDSPWWVVEPQKIGKGRDSILSQIQSIPAAGGTDIFPALQTGLNEMLNVKAERRHIILMTDGQSAGGSYYDELTERMRGERITLSTVAIGSDADTALLQSLADGGKGRYYFASDPSAIPSIFTRETAMMMRSYMVNKTFVPSAGNPGDWSSLFSQGVPPLHGYVATTVKPSAQAVLISPEPDPVLARWNYGSGRTVAWTSDLTGQWSREWVSWADFARTLTTVVKWTLPQFSASPYHSETEVTGTDVTLRVTSSTDPAPERLQATVTGEDGREQKVTLVQEAPGEYTGQVSATAPGTYLLSVTPDGADGEPAAGAVSGFVVPYSPEYRIAANSESGLNRLAELTGGRVLSWDHPEQLFAGTAEPARQLHNWSWMLLAAALLLWVADIALRRLAIPWGRFAARAAAWLPRRRNPAGASAQSAGLDRLAARKQRTASFYGGAPEAPPDRTPPAPAAGGPPPAPRAPVPSGAARPAAPPPSPPEGAAAGMDRLLAARKRGQR
ncbi:VWA domain-containing protein [Paenibacillus sp. JX-17]|uniref:VWA domain-containing protein n=1 Tax=Paenibacillus lacisoli TaxID=3064525 RepID=A0ABT9CFG2_9BACL|nr:VWA domain-containing protein [Paenibacillus sp. JX-17]MDO7907313.1 VWA domain-containing protein [Paenibacillus sp. JX-17]